MSGFTVFGQPVSWLETLAFFSGLWCVWLVKRMSLWNWPVGLFNVACFALLFLDARLYADAVLQIGFACSASTAGGNGGASKPAPAPCQ
ncbi:MAG: putative nicotinamide mononucleotide transporter [Rhodoferax sp.]|nr:putative nicotinamide mononucleotide transporter [Rhodoferax sp.]